MPKGVPDGHGKPGWLDVGDYLATLRDTTGVNWCVCVATTGGQSKERALLLSVCEYRRGTPIVRDDLAIVSGAWPSGQYRDVEASVLDMLYRLDRRLAEREKVAVQEALF